jgi:hypothetical protein
MHANRMYCMQIATHATHAHTRMQQQAQLSEELEATKAALEEALQVRPVLAQHTPLEPPRTLSNPQTLGGPFVGCDVWGAPLVTS